MRTISGLLMLVVIATLIGCSRSTPQPAGTKPGESVIGASTPDDPNANVGNLLFNPAAPPRYPSPSMSGADPIVIDNCTVNYEERQLVSAEVDGRIEVIATPMKLRDGVYEYRRSDGTVVKHDPTKPFDRKALDPGIEFLPRDMKGHKDNPEMWVPHWKLRDGDAVAGDEILCRLDDSAIINKMDAADKKKKAAQAGWKAAKAGVKFTEERIELYKNKLGLISASDYLNDQVTLSRFFENLAQSDEKIAQSDSDYVEAGLMLDRHRIKSGVNGVIRYIAKRPGEFVRAGEKIFELQSTEKVRVEGNLDVQYYDRVKKDKTVIVEPAIPSTPLKSHSQHQLEVTGVAVTGHLSRPMVVSVGLDRKALVWDPNLKGEKDRPMFPHNLPHPVAVRSVACTPPGDKNSPVLAITGAEDGKVRVWDLGATDPAKFPATPAREPADFHTSAVTAIAVSPDGKYAATAANREVFIWDVAAGKKLYALPAEHRDSVTSLSFTPQAQLVTTSRDRTVKVWKLGTEKAAVARTIDHRSGVVDILGVSPDGGRVLFDQDKGRIDLVNLSDAQTIGQITNTGPSVAFAGLALFAPDYTAAGTKPEGLPPYTIVSVGGEGDLKGGLQVWQAPRAGGRGAEIARLITPGRVAVTSAAFSPHKDEEMRFLVVGTERGTVHVWTPPSVLAKKLVGHITNIDSTDPRYVTVRVEMNNPKELGLLDRSTARVIVNPGQQ